MGKLDYAYLPTNLTDLSDLTGEFRENLSALLCYGKYRQKFYSSMISIGDKNCDLGTNVPVQIKARNQLCNP